jgi:mannose-6-phosphate isomerase-like protein (cupin superfamily)
MMSGSIDLDLEDDLGVLQTHRMGPGDSVRIPTGRTHRMTALEEAEIFEVSTPEIDDVIRVEDRYGRHTDSA